MRWRMGLVMLLATCAAPGAWARPPQETEEPPLAAVLPTGKRAFQVDLSGTGNMKGFFLSGSRVDVLVTMPQARGEAESWVAVENVLVVAVNTPAAQPGKAAPPPTATVAVTPEQEKILAQAAARGTLCLVLRAPEEEKAARADAAANGDRVPPGMRAVAVRVPEATVASAVRAGVRVDVIGTPGKGRGPAEATILLQNVRVLAVDANAGRGSVTLAVTPRDATRLLAAVDAGGSVRVLLRPDEEEGK